MSDSSVGTNSVSYGAQIVKDIRQFGVICAEILLALEIKLFKFKNLIKIDRLDGSRKASATSM